jgi:hypothetical protein
VHDVVFYPTAGLVRPLGLADVKSSKFSEQSGNEGGRVVSPKLRRNLANGILRGVGTKSRWALGAFNFRRSQVR